MADAEAKMYPPNEDRPQYQVLLDAIPKDISKESLMSALKPLLGALAVGKELADAEIYIRNKIKTHFKLIGKDVDSIIKHFKPMKARAFEKEVLKKKKAEQLLTDDPLNDVETLAAETILKSPTLLYDALNMATSCSTTSS